MPISKGCRKRSSQKFQLALADLLEQLQKVSGLNDIANLKKLKGYKTAYRIRLGDYRIGFLFEEGKIKLSRVLNRKEIYRYFP